ncbi:magnesium/cobalt transporter CorA [Endozoicomonas ascidiicola]|uniref:magnesium/cobalt transporter CorA n=1 Tax=Endozoicomonas ascidiicola TaxID=1698521 RepID=UPI000832AEE6|nr:magnesium/cobalt transporter CorA [Endozoicomonas ascidiicola]
MIYAYSAQENRFSIDRVTPDVPPAKGTIWLEATEPDIDEHQWLNTYFPGCLPDEDDLGEIEISSRYYETESGIHIRSLFPHRAGHELRNINVAFNLRPDQLITLQDEPTGLFRLMRKHLKTQHIHAATPLDIVIALFDAKVEYLADTLEEVYEDLEEVSQNTLSEDIRDVDVDEQLRTITLQEDLNGKVRLNLLDTQRSLRYLMRACNNILSDGQKDDIREMLRDIESLTPHTGFLFEKINFLMESTMGYINLEQNNIIKIFSVAAVMFMPPTLIASIYGMNFKVMPELSVEYGYPLAIGLMLLSALSTFLFFKRKGWL